MDATTTADGVEAGSVPVPRIADLLHALASVPVAADGPGMIDQLRELEDLKSLAAVKQARIAVAFDAERRREQAAPYPVAAGPTSHRRDTQTQAKGVRVSSAPNSAQSRDKARRASDLAVSAWPATGADTRPLQPQKEVV